MSAEPSTLYAKLLGETAAITWPELQPFFARGQLLWVDGHHDLITVAEAMASNDQAQVSAWLEQGVLAKLDDARAQDLHERDPFMWAVVISPWVLIQERAEPAPMH